MTFISLSGFGHCTGHHPLYNCRHLVFKIILCNNSKSGQKFDACVLSDVSKFLLREYTAGYHDILRDNGCLVPDW